MYTWRWLLCHWPKLRNKCLHKCSLCIRRMEGQVYFCSFSLHNKTCSNNCLQVVDKNLLWVFLLLHALKTNCRLIDYKKEARYSYIWPEYYNFVRHDVLVVRYLYLQPKFMGVLFMFQMVHPNYDSMFVIKEKIFSSHDLLMMWGLPDKYGLNTNSTIIAWSKKNWLFCMK